MCLCPTFNKPEYWFQRRRPLLGNGSVTTFSLANEYIRNNRKTVGFDVFCAVHDISYTEYTKRKLGD
jgi:hypothetical protein